MIAPVPVHCFSITFFSLNTTPNKSERPICVGCDSVRMSIPLEVAGDIHPQVPGAADSLQDLSMQYVLRLERVHGRCHPYNLALGGVKLHVPSSLPSLKFV